MRFADFHKFFERPVVSSFGVIRETASRQLFHAQVIVKTVAACSFFAASGIRAVAFAHVSRFVFASHKKLL
jgi:hypothetical protein